MQHETTDGNRIEPTHGDSERDPIAVKRREFVRALRACSPKERTLVRALPLYGYQLWRAAHRLGIAKLSVQRMRKRARFQRAIDALNAIEDLNAMLAAHTVRLEYQRLAHSNLKDFYDENGQALPPQEWTEDMAAAVAEYSFDRKGRPVIRLHEKKGALDAEAKLLRMMPSGAGASDGGTVRLVDPDPDV